MNLSTGTPIPQLPTGTIDNLQAVLPLTIGMPSSPQTIQASLLQFAQQAMATQFQPSGTAGDDGTGWKSISATLTFVSSDSPSFVITANANITGTVGVGARLKLTHSSSEKYFMVTQVNGVTGSTTYYNLYGGTDYTLSAGAITSPYYSLVKAPAGFPLSPAKWTQSVTDSSTRLFTATKDTWAVPTGSTANLAIPIGVWRVRYRVVSRASVSGGTPSYVNTQTTLSTTTNSETDSTTTCMDELAPGAAPVNTNNIHTLDNKIITLTSKTTYRLLHKMNTDGTASGATSGFNSAATIAAECAFL